MSKAKKIKPKFTAPGDLDTEHAARIVSALDAFAAANHRHSSIGLHEHNDAPFLWFVVADWAHRHQHQIEHYVTTANGRTYEVWNITVGEAKVSFWPLRIGHLDGKDELQSKIETIRKEADRRIQELLDVEAASP